MLAAKTSVGVAPMVNMRNQLQRKASKGPTLALKNVADVRKGPKQGYQSDNKKGLILKSTERENSNCQDLFFWIIFRYRLKCFPWMI